VAQSIDEFRLTTHAEKMLLRRGLRRSVVATVLATPGQRWTVRPGRDVLQSSVELGGRLYLARVFVDVDTDPPAVVTAYRTSKVEKYWSGES